MSYSWTIDGETLTLTAPYKIKGLTGMGGAPATVQLQKAPYQDGRSYRDTVSEERYSTIDLLIAGSDYTEILNCRRTLSRLFNAKLGKGVFAWAQSETGKTYNLDCYVEKGSPEFIEDVNSRFALRALIYLVAPQPYWYDPTAETLTMAAFEGGWSFPWSFPLSFGTVGKSMTITNDGDVNTPILLTITGYTDSPVIENETTGETIAVNREIPLGSSLEIYTAFGQKRVELIDSAGTRSNAFHYVTAGTGYSLWQLAPGANVINYTAASESGNPTATIEYYNRYSGI